MIAVIKQVSMYYLKKKIIIECNIFCFYVLYCFTFCVKHLILSVVLIIFVHVRHIRRYVLKMLNTSLLFKISKLLVHEPSYVGSSFIMYI